MTADAANTGGGAGTPGPPTKPAKKFMTAKDVATESGRHHETVLLALRRGLLKGTQPPQPKSRWVIRTEDFEDWMGRGAPVQNIA